MITLAHNAGGCMRPLVTEKIWGRLKNRRDMYCRLTKRPIIDMSIYSRNRNFKDPGSSKYAGFYQYPLPTRDFFMVTRMADRLKPPDLETEQLNLKGTLTLRSSALSDNQDCKRSTRKRQLAGENKITEINNTNVKPLCRGDISKKRRVWSAEVSPITSSSDSYAIACKRSKADANLGQHP